MSVSSTHGSGGTHSSSSTSSSSSAPATGKAGGRKVTAQPSIKEKQAQLGLDKLVGRTPPTQSSVPPLPPKTTAKQTQNAPPQSSQTSSTLAVNDPIFDFLHDPNFTGRYGDRVKDKSKDWSLKITPSKDGQSFITVERAKYLEDGNWVEIKENGKISKSNVDGIIVNKMSEHKLTSKNASSSRSIEDIETNHIKYEYETRTTIVPASDENKQTVGEKLHGLSLRARSKLAKPQ